MKRIALLLLISFFSFQALAQDEVTTFILVRHAEKAKDDPRNPSLSDVGLARAEALKTLMAQAEIGALYSTPYKRTKSTLAPIAEDKGLEINLYDPRSSDFLKEIMEKYKGQTVIVSGHSNTTPMVANMLLGEEKFKQLSESDYGKIFVVSVTKIGKGSVTLLNY